MSSSHSGLVVALGGVTNGGKTTVCEKIAQIFHSDDYHLHVRTLHLDDYYWPSDDVRHTHLIEYDHHDWDCLTALDIDRFLRDLQATRYQCDLLLVEGFLVFNILALSVSLNDDLRFHLAYYFDLPYEECARRRLQRQYDPPDPDGYFQGHVWPAYVKAKKEVFEQNANLQVQLIDTSRETFETVIDRLQKNIQVALKNIIR
jgi:nicotinamide/nicotinate riboside kinase